MLDDIVKDYAAYLRQQEKSPATIDKYTRYAKAFMAFAGSERVTRETAVAYKEHIASVYTAAGANGMIAAVNSFLCFTGKPDLRLKPLKVQRGHFAPRERTLSRPELEQLLAAALRGGNRRLALLIQTLFATGIRVSELRFITMEAAARGRAEIRLKGKTRTIFLPGKLCAKLRAYAAQEGVASGAVFVTRTGNPLDRSNIWAQMKTLCAASGVAAGKVFPHSLRHLFARTYYQHIPDIVELAGIMGNSDINTTRGYTTSIGDDCLKRLDSLELVY